MSAVSRTVTHLHITVACPTWCCDGVNVYPREIEDVLYLHPAVVDCAVFGVPDDRHGEVLHAVVGRGRP